MRGLLAPFLRDTLVAYNYVHYAPPGAQVLYTNPVFVRSHDFLGVQGANHMWRATEVFGSGWPSNGGGRLVGSLAGLPYALAEAEQNFLVPDQTQALIWGDLVPQMIVSAVIPRWWNVTPSQLHWVALHMRYAESLLAESALDPALRAKVLACARARRRRRRAWARWTCCSQTGDVQAALDKVTPSELFVLASRMDEDPQSRASSPLLAEIRRLAAAIAATDQLCRHLGRLRHTQAHAGQLLPAGAAQPAHVPDVDGILQPHSGRKLGIQHAVLGANWPTRRTSGRRSSTCASRSGPRNWWSIFSPRTWRTGRRCCARCAAWATTCATKARPAGCRTGGAAATD